MEPNCTEYEGCYPPTGTILCGTENASLCGEPVGPDDYLVVQRMQYQNIIGAIVMLLIILLSICGNVVVILAILKTPKLRDDISNMLLINLSLTDLFSATFVMPYSLVALIADDWLLGEQWCTAQCALNYCCIIVSMLTLSLISIDRCVAIVYPLRYMSIVNHTLIYVMATYTWVQGFAFAAVPIVCHWVVYDYWEVVCAIDWDSYRDHGGLTYVIVAFIVCFMIPAIMMTICYVRIYRAACGHYRRQSAASSGRHQTARGNLAQQKAEKKVVLSLAIVVVMFFICTTPFCVTKVIKIFYSTDSVPVWLNFFATFAQYIASATNPFIYGIFRQDFRRAFTALLCLNQVLPFHSNTNSFKNSKTNNLIRNSTKTKRNNWSACPEPTAPIFGACTPPVIAEASSNSGSTV